jgi:F-type H+-transporting ATPase subunit c
MKFKTRKVLFSLLSVMMLAVPAFAQGAGSGVTDKGYAAIAAGIGFAIAAGMTALGQGRAAAAACESMARNPSAGGRIQTLMILGLAFMETMAIFTLVIIFAVVRGVAIG